MTPTEKKLLEENIELKAKLAEAEDTLRAIREGEVDAIVVSDDTGERIYTLEGAESSYRRFLEQMQEGAATIALDGQILFANRSFAEIFGLPLGDVLGRSLESFIPPEALPILRNVLKPGRRDSETREFRLQQQNGAERPIRLSFSPATGDEAETISIVAVDLSERESEERLQQALTVSHSFAFEWDAVTDRVVRSASCGELLGLSGKEAIYDTGQQYFQRIHPEDRQRFIQIVRDLKPGADSYHTEYRVMRPDGGIRIFEEIGRSSFDSDKSLQRVVGTATDITERKRAEEAVRASEERYRRLLQSMPLPVGVVSRNGEIIYFNDRFTQVFGYTQEDLPTLEAWWNRAYPDAAYRRRVVENWQAKLRRSDSARSATDPEEFNVTCKDGSVRVAVITNIGIEDCILAVFIDVTDRKLAEAALRESHARLKKVLEVETVGVMFWDLNTGRLTDANDSFLNLMGYSRREVEAGELTWQKLTPAGVRGCELGRD